ncbi:hypothetical protein [Arthrobacter sp. ISL-65]|uniref:hypothetical protein n=1 Tax=Arthrobacter sp. ISL-65 TaxID=2819112 RepID=UPI001BE94240|nr:hypothetical protein [Arthrobacter sp. ISL-65]MBT2549741.1 hypothetical protein [Arthrobacter sp. ISL-65]
MTEPAPIGYITLRVPVFQERESESWEIPEEYFYLRAGEAELVSHDIPAALHECTRDELIECGGISLAPWDAAEMAAKTTRTEEPASAPGPAALILNFPKGA